LASEGEGSLIQTQGLHDMKTSQVDLKLQNPFFLFMETNNKLPFAEQ
jgi:hypothetical protein